MTRPLGAVANSLSHTVFHQVLPSVKRTGALVVRSPLLWTFGPLLGSAYFLPPAAVTCILGCVVGAMVKWPQHIPKSLLYEGVMVDNIAGDRFTRMGIVQRPYCSLISKKVYVSALPLSNRNDYDTINPKAVLAVVEDFELTTETLFSKPMTESDWTLKGVRDYKQMRVVDLSTISLQELDEAADFIQKHEDDGVIVHCKAGRGRSAMCAAAYLMKYSDKTSSCYRNAKSAIAYVKAKRAHSSIKPWQVTRLTEYEGSLKQANQVSA